MSANEGANLMAIREQISDNVQVALDAIWQGKGDGKDASDTAIKVITVYTGDTWTASVCFWANGYEPLMIAKPAQTATKALESLLKVSSRVLMMMMEVGKLGSPSEHLKGQDSYLALFCKLGLALEDGSVAKKETSATQEKAEGVPKDRKCEDADVPGGDAMDACGETAETEDTAAVFARLQSKVDALAACGSEG